VASLIIQRQGSIGSIVFSNPPKYNAMTLEMWTGFPAAVRDLDDDPSIRVIVLEGDGDKAFVSGSDISQFESKRSDPESQRQYNAAVEEAYLAPVRCSKPVLAKIRGICMGGGAGLAAACDLRICCDNARFQIPAARLGLGYPTTGVRRLMSIVGAQNASDILFSARRFSAAEALRIGFVTRMIEAAHFEADIADWLAMVAENAPLTLQALKRALVELQKDPGERDGASVDRAIAACFASEDYREGARAFKEKRKPVFTGR
jgi:enoyl-CoA hydratase